MKISKYLLSIFILSLIFLVGCDKIKEVQKSITPAALPTVIAEKSDFQTTENTGKFALKKTGNVLKGTGEVGMFAVKKTGNVLRGTGKIGKYGLRKTGNVFRGTGNVGKNIFRKTMRFIGIRK